MVRMDKVFECTLFRVYQLNREVNKIKGLLQELNIGYWETIEGNLYELGVGELTLITAKDVGLVNGWQMYRVTIASWRDSKWERVFTGRFTDDPLEPAEVFKAKEEA